MQCRDFFLAVHAPAVLGNEFHRAWAIERDGGDNVFKDAWPHLPKHLLHAAGFHLKDTDGVALANHAKGVIEQCALFIALSFFVAIGNAVDAVVEAAMARDQFAGFAHDGER